MQYGLVRDISEGNIAELDLAFDSAEGESAPWVFVFGALVEHFAGALESGEGFGDLGSDGDDLEERCGEVSEKHDVGESIRRG